MESTLQTVANAAREAQETLDELKNAAKIASSEYNDALWALNEKKRFLLAAEGKVDLQKKILADYLKDMHDISVTGLERLDR